MLRIKKNPTAVRVGPQNWESFCQKKIADEEQGERSEGRPDALDQGAELPRATGILAEQQQPRDR
jgi:hypothetical protein